MSGQSQPGIPARDFSRPMGSEYLLDGVEVPGWIVGSRVATTVRVGAHADDDCSFV